jgi:hypothetical protein
VKHNGEVGNLPGGGWGVITSEPVERFDRRPPPSVGVAGLGLTGFVCCPACSNDIPASQRCKPGVDLETLTDMELRSSTCKACILDRRDEFDRRARIARYHQAGPGHWEHTWIEDNDNTRTRRRGWFGKKRK